jgi:beta-N-acetylhexosaminidase
VTSEIRTRRPSQTALLPPDVLEQRLGQLIVGGFEGTTPPADLLERVARGHLGGVILFARNIEGPAQVLALTSALREAAPREAPLVVAVDQEGGRVARLRAPCTEWPPMQRLGNRDDPELTRRVGAAIGRELAALGFNLDFAPVVDVATNPDNPVIGDRAFGSTAKRVSEQAIAFARGLEEAGVLSCVKHYPGHGDTEQDSHLTLPVVRLPAERLRLVELAPFVAAAQAHLPLLMTAHVVFTAFDEVPATLSERLVQDVLRFDLGYQGVVITDDMEMSAIAGRMSVPEASVAAVRAGCDLVLICHKPELQEATRLLLLEAAHRDARMVRRLTDSLGRVARLKARPELSTPWARVSELDARLGTAEHRALAASF